MLQIDSIELIGREHKKTIFFWLEIIFGIVQGRCVRYLKMQIFIQIRVLESRQ
jgi:hypothetical protein